MPSEPDYVCTVCKQPFPRDLLTCKKAVFLEMGSGAATHRSRVVAWLCPKDLVNDEDWKRPPRQAPGNKPREEVQLNVAETV